MFRNHIDTPIESQGQHTTTGTNPTPTTHLPHELAMEYHVGVARNMSRIFSMSVMLEAHTPFTMELCATRVDGERVYVCGAIKQTCQDIKEIGEHLTYDS